MLENYFLYISFDGNQILGVKDTEPAQTCLNVQISENSITYRKQSHLSVNMESYVSVPLDLMIEIGIVKAESFFDFTQRTGIFPNYYEGDAHLQYHLYESEESEELYLLQHKIPIPETENKTATNEDFSDVRREEYIQRYGSRFFKEGKKVLQEKGMFYVNRKRKYKYIPLYPLLSTGLTSVEIIQKLGGKYIFKTEVK